MTLDTQVLFAAQLEIVLEICPHGMMTTHTGHHLPGALVNDLLSYRMSEFPLGLVTAGAGVVSPVLEHGKVIGTVNGVTLLAIKGLGMDIKSVLVPVEAVFVTAPADLLLAPFEQTRCIPGVGAVTRSATVPLLIQKVAMDGQDILFYFLMATQAGFRSRTALGVTFGTSFFKGLVEDVSYHGLAAASVWVVAGKTITYLCRVVWMGLLHHIPFMAGYT